MLIQEALEHLSSQGHKGHTGQTFTATHRAISERNPETN